MGIFCYYWVAIYVLPAKNMSVSQSTSLKHRKSYESNHIHTGVQNTDININVNNIPVKIHKGNLTG